LIERAESAVGTPAERQAVYIKAERILCQQEAIVIPVLHHYIDY
jgi:hypothetical protein